MLREIAIVFGDLLIIVGILGMMSLAFITEGVLPDLLLGTMEQSVMHLVVGGMALAAGLVGEKVSQVFFKVIGLGAVWALFIGSLMDIHSTFAFVEHSYWLWVYAGISISAFLLGFSEEVSQEGRVMNQVPAAR